MSYFIIGVGVLLLGLRRVWWAFEGRGASAPTDPVATIAQARVPPWASSTLFMHTLVASFFLSGAGVMFALALHSTIAEIIFGAAVSVVALIALVRAALILRIVHRNRRSG